MVWLDEKEDVRDVVGILSESMLGILTSAVDAVVEMQLY
jgi:hypothetical protein